MIEMIEKMSKSLILICLLLLADVFNNNEMMCGHLVGAVPISMTSSIPKVDADSRVGSWTRRLRSSRMRLRISRKM